ncbi:hypothetical protein ACFL4L_04185 [bacterium]
MKPDEIPEREKTRLELFEMFYPLERKTERQWAKTFKSHFKIIAQKFKDLSIEKGYIQEEINEQFILWRHSEDAAVECMFYFVMDVTELSSIHYCFEHIKQYDVYLTYIIANQKHDGENVFDIFRSSEFSYLEHCNRVKYPS